MKITLLGATGRTGRLILQYLLRAGHDVTVLVRSPARLHEQLFTTGIPPLDSQAMPIRGEMELLPDSFADQLEMVPDAAAWTRGQSAHARLHILTGDTRDRNELAAALSGSAAVISAIGTDKSDALTVTMQALIPLMEQQSSSRLITIGTAGILQSRTAADQYRYQTTESRQRSTRAAEEHRKVYEWLHSSTLQWTIVCPTYLPDGDYTGAYRMERDLLPAGGTRITTGDTAYVVYSQLQDERYIRCRIGLSD
ncbi:NAD(P)-dependent oxidoreductase [Paenibacillus sp. SGZ-1009]|uniref:NAD(P)-dependent oxidoreductase n=1 Tax=Paenibacillus campi TaxID=3106031 RepID=UPI002AFEC352|nr:NAD(P)H-binding protein [Paenibacillus sp. SGZ-1009]